MSFVMCYDVVYDVHDVLLFSGLGEFSIACGTVLREIRNNDRIGHSGLQCNHIDFR